MKEKDLYFKLVCFYLAKTEEYDRTLTDLRDEYDQTCACVTGIAARYSNSYAQKIIRQIAKCGFSLKHFGEVLHNHVEKHSAQWWIDTYHYLLENGEMDFVEDIMKKNGEKDENSLFVKNPLL